MDYVIRAILGIIVAILFVKFLFPMFGFSGDLLFMFELLLLVCVFWYAWRGPSITGK